MRRKRIAVLIASIAGVALDSKENRDPTELFRQAGIALYYVRDHG